MGATLNNLRRGALAKRLAKIRNAVWGKSVVAGYIEGVSSNDAVYKAYQNEWGFTSSDLKREVLPRPFVHNSIPIMKSELSKGVGVPFALESIDRYLDASGAVMADCIRMSIDAGGFKPNADYTLKRKSGTKPLVDTGEMYEQAKHQVRTEEVPF
jgi:hypothetical protein